MTEHTKGLLALFRNGQSVGSVDGYGVCELWPRTDEGFPNCEGKENGRRIVACWNLLDGYATEELEGVTLAEFVAKQAFISQFDANDGINLSISGVAVQLLAASFAGQFKASGATNYLEMSGNHPETGPFTITMQRKHGLTPVEKLAAMTKQRDVLLEALNGVLGVMNNSQGVAGWHKNGDIASWDELLPEVAAALEFVEGEQS
ncbi:hypothetical protein [Aeromonas jandaei]|uniref:hypothetical protein n=1 Tax=Aeromonas jandaei TaxID=650 RepID=UPI002B054915|nr:hypothetical protein [Aeromonas jandaei]